ncbi:MAG: hypothetical protein QNJ47_09260 [Nostocaceae cyanobacterium]|nr:hypothetical protein [Nostocaceae cyanobacterium]
MHQSVSTIDYNIQLLINVGNSTTGGELLVDTYTFDPKLAIGDTVKIEDWKVGVKKNNELTNEVFSFNATVMDIRRTIVRHQNFVVDIIIESPGKTTISQLRDALRENNELVMV